MNKNHLIDKLLLKKTTTISIFLLITFYQSCDKSKSPSPADLDYIIRPPTLSAELLQNRLVKLTWINNDAEICRFQVWRKSANENNFIKICESDKNVTFYIDKDYIYGDTYTYKVLAFVSSNSSDFSEEETVCTKFPAPTNLSSVALENQSIKLTWTDNCSFESGFQIERKNDNGSYYRIAVVDANVSYYLDTGLTTREKYTYRVRACAGQNRSDYSNETSIPTLLSILISAPTKITTKRLNNQSIELTWTDNCNFESGYKIERSTGTNPFIEIARTSANVHEYVDKKNVDLLSNYYTYRLRAFTSSNNSEYSNTIHVGNGLAMVHIAGGGFQMGKKGNFDEGPEHRVRIADFYIGKYEITQKEWGEIYDNNPSGYQGNEFPVESVSWYDAIEFCNRKSKMSDLSPCYSIKGKQVICDWNADGYRLPTEAEWEYASRGANQSHGYIYSGSDDFYLVAWIWINSGNITHKVGGKQPDELGIYDMSGNVAEWCWDWYDSDYYRLSPSTDPKGPNSGIKKVVRGGGMDNSASIVQCTHRSVEDPEKYQKSIGFRVVRSAK